VTRQFGYLPDPPSKDDRKIGALLGAFAASPPPANADTWNNVCPIRYQTISSSCVGHAWMRALRLACLRAGIACPELSPLYAYLLARAQHGGEHEDVGTYLRSGGQALKKFGAASEEAWPFDESKINVQPNLRALHDGYDRKKLSGYYRIDSGDVDGVRRAIAAGHPVVAGWQITQAFVDWNGKGVIGRQRGPIVGGHAMPVVAYAADGTFRLPNSWDYTWGDRGFAVVDDEFIASGDDVWAVAA
jgi:hypothetical protein